MKEVAGALSLTLTPEQIDRSLFADLKDEQRVQTFDDITAERLLDRYNVALAQAILLRCTAMEVRVWGETPARFRQLFRAVKFHRLICTIHETPGNSLHAQARRPAVAVLLDATSTGCNWRCSCPRCSTARRST